MMKSKTQTSKIYPELIFMNDKFFFVRHVLIEKNNLAIINRYWDDPYSIREVMKDLKTMELFEHTGLILKSKKNNYDKLKKL